MIIDHVLIDRLEELGARAWHKPVWRHFFANRNPLAPSRAGGRWAPPAQFAVLYTSLTRDGAVAEGSHVIAQYSIPPSVPRYLCRIAVRLQRVVDLMSFATLEQLGVDTTSFAREWGRCPEIGAAANFLGYQGLVVPSARSRRGNLVILMDQLDATCSVELAAGTTPERF